MRKKMKVLLFRAILIGLAVFLTGMIFPSYSYAATASLQITAGADDATEDARQAVTTTDELQVRSYPGATPWQRRSTGLRFQNIPVPRGATVISSYISIFPSLATANDVNARIYVENTADASDFVVNRHIINPAYRPRTTAFTSWVQDDVAVNTYVNGPSLNAPLQELFNRADWAAGNDLAILMIANEDIDKIVRFWNQEKYLNLPVKLYIEYSTGPVPDTTPPVRSNGQPTGTLPAGTTSVTISLTTNEPATARYATTPGVSYDAMSNNFTTTGGTSHSTLVTGLADGNTYTYYVRTSDAAGNNNTDDYLISFSIALPDTTPPVRSN
ncbi:MAG: hypothetical protein HY665_09455, partial [Chloroflexi bacterium]|nr:hypothetical protein [Chloroflexota bacterium]